MTHQIFYMSNTLEPRELAQATAKLASIGEEMRRILLFQAKEAAESDNTIWLVQVSGDAKEVEECVAKLESIGKTLHEILTNTLGFEDEKEESPEEKERSARLFADLFPDPPAKRLRRIRSEITQGEINQNLLTLTSARKRGHIRIGEHFKIRMPDGQEFETELVHPGNRLRERGWIREFYRQQGIKPGDFVVLEEIEPGIWKLNKDTSPATPAPISS